MADQPASLASALAELQAQLPHIGKAKTAKVTTKDKGSYSYTYADLAVISRELLPLMAKLGLAFTCRPTLTETGAFVLDYTLMHDGGETIAGGYPLPDPTRTTPQQVGSAITYARRYCLCAVTGLAPDDDDDDAAAASKQAPQRTRAKIPGPDHERLQPRREPGDRPAERGPVPPEEDHWNGQPAGDYEPGETSLPQRARKPYTPAQLIAMHWARLGITDDDERHNWTARMAGRTELASTSNLPVEQQKEILAALAQCKDIGKVQEWIDDKVAAS